MRASGVQLTRTAHVRALVQSLRVRELQFILADLNLARSGRKQELIDRIVGALEQFEVKASENASNHATSAYYNDQLTAALRSIDTHIQTTRQSHHATASIPMPQLVSAAHYAPRGPIGLPGSMRPMQRMPLPEPTPYGRPIPYPYSLPHSAPQTPPPPAPANDILRATTPAALHGARCFCGNESSSTSRLISCTECGLQVHAKCHQLVTHAATAGWYCESCRAVLYDPFLRVQKTVLAPVFVKFNRNHVPFRIEYVISDQDLNDLYAKRDPKQGNMTPGSLELQLRVFALKEELGTGTSWPTTSTISANGFTLPLVQRAPPGQSNPSKVLREQPVNLFPFSRVGRNTIEVRTGENPLVFAFLVQIVEFRNVDELLKQVVAASAALTYDDAKAQVIRSFGGGGGGDDDDDDEIEMTSTTDTSIFFGPKQGEKYNESVDIWALGIIMYELLVGKPPFEAPGQDETIQRITDGALPVPPNLSLAAKDLLQRILQKDPTERLTLHEIKAHRWFSNVGVRQRRATGA